jgi:hypothetical protein
VWVTFNTDSAAGPYIHGTMEQNPAYNGKPAQNGNDIAAILLDSAPDGITPASLPAVGLFDQMKAEKTLGACYGDSGGPNFIGTTDTIAAITITADTACAATNVDLRLDTKSAQDLPRAVRRPARLTACEGAPVLGRRRPGARLTPLCPGTS